MKRGWSRAPALVFVLAAAVTACSQSKDDKAVGIKVPIVKEVTRENYLSGKAFCQVYSSITSKEDGRWIKVPKSYSDPSRGEMEIYAYTAKKFDPARATIVFLDGGPGQNTHGMDLELTGGFNEIHFDQRGLGCSALPTYDEYLQPWLYSSQNNVLDMEAIRKAYGLKSWAVYGVSYGTVPATMYASQFPQWTRALVLEGVVGDLREIHRWGYKIEKANAIYNSFTEAQKDGFAAAISNPNFMKLVFTYFFNLPGYMDRGYKQVSELFQRQVFESSGQVNMAVVNAWAEGQQNKVDPYPYPQQPSATDANVLRILYCKNLGMRHQAGQDLDFTRARGFVEVAAASTGDKECDKARVSLADESLYDIAKIRVSVPTYYFQGSHDGATLATGAIAHWRQVPIAKSTFLLAQKGGHNPNLQRLSDKDVAPQQRLVNVYAFLGKDIREEDVRGVNLAARFTSRYGEWIMKTGSPRAQQNPFPGESDGIRASAPAWIVDLQN